jgi:uncharacterized membrane protein (DUF485 family)
MPATEDADPYPAQPGDHELDDQFASRRIRAVLTASAVVLVLILALPVLTSFTSALDGVVGGIGVAYIVGFGEFVLAMAGAVVYCRWVNRIEADAEQPDGVPR